MNKFRKFYIFSSGVICSFAFSYLNVESEKVRTLKYDRDV